MSEFEKTIDKLIYARNNASEIPNEIKYKVKKLDDYDTENKIVHNSHRYISLEHVNKTQSFVEHIRETDNNAKNGQYLKNRLLENFPYMDKINWKNVVVAGGIFNSLFFYDISNDYIDIDFFFYNCTKTDFLESVGDIILTIRDYFYHEYHWADDDTTRKGTSVKFVYTKNAITITLHFPRGSKEAGSISRYQFIYKYIDCESFGEILYNFDLNCCKFAYNGEDVYTNDDGIFAVNYKTNIIYNDYCNYGNIRRIEKYMERGFNIVFADSFTNKVLYVTTHNNIVSAKLKIKGPPDSNKAFQFKDDPYDRHENDICKIEYFYRKIANESFAYYVSKIYNSHENEPMYLCDNESTNNGDRIKNVENITVIDEIYDTPGDSIWCVIFAKYDEFMDKWTEFLLNRLVGELGAPLKPLVGDLRSP